jgi:lipopolysaccharide/colanic/teichoic acid biosynthesis glycosyltransferase
MKRLFDVVAAALALLALALPLLALAVAVRLGSRGPALFRQERVGRRGQTFRILKLRTMVDKVSGPLVTAAGDARVTPLGRFLRRYKLDELPQLWNVLVGDMSFVGPRPEVPRFVAVYGLADRALLEVRPGITDPASLHLRNEEELLGRFADRERAYLEVLLPLKLDLQRDYLARRSFAGDLALILRTLLRIAILTLVTAGAHAQPNGAPVGTTTTRTIVVGRPVAFVPASRPATVICDDLSVVRVDDAGTFLRVTGLKPGATDCSFSSLLAPGQRAVYHFVIVR